MQSKKGNRLGNLQWDKYMVYIIFVAVFIVFSVTLGNKGFLGANNLLNVLRQTAMISVMAVACTFVMAAGQIDLTVGAVAAMTAMIVSLILKSTNSILLALAAGLGFGCLVGLVNGILITKLRLPAFLATMGMMQVVRGSAMWITDTAAVPIENTGFNFIFGVGNIAGIPVLICGNHVCSASTGRPLFLWRRGRDVCHSCSSTGRNLYVRRHRIRNRCIIWIYFNGTY